MLLAAFATVARGFAPELEASVEITWGSAVLAIAALSVLFARVLAPRCGPASARRRDGRCVRLDTETKGEGGRGAARDPPAARDRFAIA